MPARRIAILGGGITGLSAAHRCRELAAQRGLDIETIVLESASTVGGCIETRQDRGFVLEMGPDSLVTEKPAAIDLLKRLELTDDVEPIRENFRGARVVRAGRLIPIPSDFRLFTPMSLSGLITSRLFSPMGIARAAFEPFVPAMVTDVDESLASFVTRRFGREVLDRLAGPLIGGIYSGDPERLSMQATLPQLLDLERRFGSLIRGMRSMQQPSKAALSVHRLVSLRNGLGALVTTLEKKLQGAIRTSSHIVRLRRRHEVGEGAPWSITLADSTNIDADFVISALPAHAAERLLRGIDPHLAEILGGIRYHSATTVTMAFASNELPPLPRCTGFVVPKSEARKVMAVTFSTQKYAHRAPEGFTVMRAFVGGHLQPWMATLEDSELIDAIHAELHALLGISAPPKWAIVRRWKNALPEYSVGHSNKLGEIDRAVAAIDGFALAGSAYRGAGIADCIRSGESAASDAIAQTEKSSIVRCG